MIGLGLGLTTAKVVHDVVKSDKIEAKALAKSEKAYAIKTESDMKLKASNENLNNATLKLVNRKKAILVTTMKRFVDLYERIMKIQFTESEGIYELLNVSNSTVSNLSVQINAVQDLGSDSFFTKNVVVGLFTGGILGALSSSMIDDAENKYNQAKLQLSNAYVAKEHNDTIILAHNAFIKRIDSMTSILTILNQKFFKYINDSEKIIDKNGYDRCLYSSEDRRLLATSINVAGAIKSIIDAPIIDENGELTKESFAVIEAGQKCIDNLNANL